MPGNSHAHRTVMISSTVAVDGEGEERRSPWKPICLLSENLLEHNIAGKIFATAMKSSNSKFDF